MAPTHQHIQTHTYHISMCIRTILYSYYIIYLHSRYTHTYIYIIHTIYTQNIYCITEDTIVLVTYTYLYIRIKNFEKRRVYIIIIIYIYIYITSKVIWYRY